MSGINDLSSEDPYFNSTTNNIIVNNQLVALCKLGFQPSYNKFQFIGEYSCTEMWNIKEMMMHKEFNILIDIALINYWYTVVSFIVHIT